MADQVITCPSCKSQIPLTEALSSQIRESTRKELEGDFARKLAADRERLGKEARAWAEQNFDTKMKDLQSQVEEKNKRLADAQAAQLAFLKEKRELQEKQERLELDIAKRLDEERKRIFDDTTRKLSDEHRQKDLEKEKLIADLKRQTEELTRKIEQGSQQTQGEVVELELENLLRAKFPFDTIEPVGKGIRGADVVQHVHNQSGRHCGTIIWESKQTKAWSPGWIEKLKDDQRAIKADLAVLLTATLPKEIASFGPMDGVWVTNNVCALSLAIALRGQLIQIALAKAAAGGTLEKKEAVYTYLTSNEFKQHIEAVVETAASMRDQLSKEKIAFEKIWSMREKQIDRVNKQMAGLFGDLKGLGASIPSIKSLEIDDLGESALPAPAKPALPSVERSRTPVPSSEDSLF